MIFAGLILMILPHTAESEEINAAASTALVNLNREFINAHAVARKLDLASGGPIILLEDGKLVLVRNGSETTSEMLLPRYDTVKVFAHMPVAIYLMLGPPVAGQLDTQRLQQLADYHRQIDRVEKQIEHMALEATSLKRQQQLLADSRQFLEKVIQRQEFSTEELHAFTRSMLPMIQANIAEAASSQLDTMHEQVMAWKKELTPEEWQKLRVSVKGAVLARDDNLAMQYFERLLNLEGPGMRLIYMERYVPPTPMLSLLATRSVDRGISIAFFDNPDRMFRDVLADAANAHIKTMKFD
ncbi:MAG TPA: hypothetical protein DCM07_18640 [Planctomycetaceae bacterium]|nr:hypothetical protein [Gimesia sp.]HAH46827.1 hypothetical protein [Planctomycetaceae bacterium]HBL45205.1 hypothetical protein [Planctomycetaceae bacterium]|tara:strand:+ start:36 stop:929 length:894 start_codon:yes stop_codon:yes gene_type:complete